MSGGDDIVSVGSLGCARASWKKGSLKSSMCFSSEMRPLQASLSFEHRDYVEYTPVTDAWTARIDRSPLRRASKMRSDISELPPSLDDA